MTTRRQQPTDILAIFEDERAAEAAAEAVRATGVAADAIRVGARRDEVASLQAEQREEMEHTFVGPGNVGPFTKEMTKWMLPSIVVGSIIGAVVCLPLAWLRLGPGADLDFGMKLFVVLSLGVVTGATIGFVAGGGLGARGPKEPLGAEKGVTVNINAPSREAARDVANVLRTKDPVRIDLTTPDGQPIETVTTEGELADL